MRIRTVKIDDVKANSRNALVGGPFGSNLTTRDYVEDGVPVIRGGNLPMEQNFLDSDFVFVSEEKAEDLSSNIARPGDIIFTQRGTLGQVGVIPRDAKYPKYIVSQSQMKLTVDATKADVRFVYYFFKHPDTVTLIKNRAISSGVPHINLGILREFEMPLPSLVSQSKICDILSTYDDLIENNRRRIELLEASVRHLYEEWFVRLRFPGHEHTKITNGVPEAWRTALLEEVAEFRLGKMLDEQKNKGEARPYLANVNVRWGQIELSDLREMRFEEHEIDTFGLKYGDIIMCEGGEPGRCAIWKDQMPGMMIQKAIHRIRARSNIDFVYLYHCLRHRGQTGQLATLFTGATIKHLPKEKLAKVSIHVAGSQLMDLFVEQVRPIEVQINLLESCNRKAVQARDLLLPRLMSGEVPV